MDNLTKIAQLINNGMILLGRKIDALTQEIRSKKPPIINIPSTDINFSIPDEVANKIKIPEVDTTGMEKAIKEGMSSIQVNVPSFPSFPEIKVPEAKITVKIPKIPAPIVNVPPAQITVEPAKVEFPETMKVEGMDELLKSVSRETPEINLRKDITSKNPLSVMVVDAKGRHITDFGSDITAPSVVGVKTGTTQVDQDHPFPVTVDGFSIPMFDTQIIDETLAPATTVITYTRDGNTVAVKTIIISGNITTITVV